MIILTIRTDKPEAELGLYGDDTQVAYKTWQAHRQLSETILTKIEALLGSQAKTWHHIEGIVCFAGPGSFTGLRIGMTVGNTLASSLDIPIVGSEGSQWIAKGLARLHAGKGESLALPNYGSEAHITQQKR